MRRTVPFSTLAISFALIAACSGGDADAPPAADPPAVADAPAAASPAATRPVDAPVPAADAPFTTTEVARFASPWAMTFLPDGRLLVTEMAGTLKLFDPATGTTGTVTGVPEVVHRGQGGLGDVVLHPDHANNGLVYLSYVEAGDGGTGSAVARGRLVPDDAGGGALQDVEVIWRQSPKMSGDGHFAQRLAFGRGGLLYISSGERQHFDPAQDMSGNLGKIVRVTADGAVHPGNPFADQGGVAAQVWSLGHRNILGMAFDADGTLWAHEMGPKGGDELNRIAQGGNYGYPIVSDGDHYDGKDIPDHSTRPEFRKPVITWTPVIAPAGFVIYDGAMFPAWKGTGLIGGLASEALVRVSLGEGARELERFAMGRRIREVEQGPDGAVWLLADGDDGWLLKLTPATAPGDDAAVTP